MTDAWIGPRALAEASGVSTDTLRHYERLGLLQGRMHAHDAIHLAAVDACPIQRALVVGC
jgi:hypothetical protein